MSLRKRLKRFFSDPAFGTSSRGRMRAWKVTSAGPNTLIVYSVEEMRRKSRDLTRNFGYMNGAYETIASNIVGPGIRVLPRHDDCDYCEKIVALWNWWQNHCDLEGVHNLKSLLSLAVRERWEAGEVFIRFIPDNSGRIPLKLQIIPAEQVKIDENFYDSGTNERVIAGVRFDKMGHRKSFILYRDNPNESLIPTNATDTVEVPADEICHYFKPLWAGQVRGVPEAFAVLLKSREMLEYDEAELAKKKLSAMLAGFVTTPTPDGALNSDDEDEDAGPGEAIAELTTGTITTLAPGEDIKFNPTTESGSSYEPFMAQNLRLIANAVQLTYEEFANDMSKTNFSSSRMGLNITQRKHRQEQDRLIHQVLRRIWERFVEAVVLSGELDIDVTEYADNPDAFHAAHFQPAGWAYVNPQQEVAAEKEKVLCGFASRSQIISENGGDAAEVDKQIAADADRAASLGLVFSIDPTNGRGAPEPNSSEDIEKN
ncbi:MAG: phage portal protein [Alphaproteobacteria bacterium]|nr:phage portal protein [Alphaproteobacteria bacterium]